MHRIRDYITNVLNGMAWGLFSSLLVGLIIKQIGVLTKLELLVTIGNICQKFMGPAIGVGVALSIDAPILVALSAVAVGAIGAGSVTLLEGSALISVGEPVGAFVASLIASELGKRIAGHTPVDIILVPMVSIVVGGLVGQYIAPYVTQMMNALGALINYTTTLHPVSMGILLSVLMGVILTLPISSAALAISLNLSGLAAAAATVGCCCNMIGYAVISYKDNDLGGSIAQGLGTSMLQIPNLIKKPILWIPVIFSSAILGPISTAVFLMESKASGAGMGTSGLVGQFAMMEVMGHTPSVLFKIFLMHFLLPAILTYICYAFMKSRKWILAGDLTLRSMNKKNGK